MLSFLFTLIAFAEEPALDETHEEPGAEMPPESIQKQPKLPVIVELKNGSILKGEVAFTQVTKWNPKVSGTLFLYIEGEPMPIPFDMVQNLEQDNEYYTKNATNELDQAPTTKEEALSKLRTTPPSPMGFSYQNPAASRYLYSPSSIGMQKGQGYVSQKLLFTTGVYALTDNITVLFGGLGPIVTVMGGKISTPVANDLYISAGAEVFFLPFSDTPLAANVAFAGITYGNLDRHISINSGYMNGENLMDDDLLKGIPIIIAGHTRASERLALVTENWLLLDPSEDGSSYGLSVGSFALRIIGRRDSTAQTKGALHTKSGYPRSTWDIGVVFVHGVQGYSPYDLSAAGTVQSDFVEPFTFGPIPWVDYTWHFGPSRRVE